MLSVLIVLIAVIAYLFRYWPTRINYRHIRKITSGERRFVSRVKRTRPNNEFYVDPLPSEMDNHADTICFGKNFRPIYFTSQVCTVSPFLDSYESRLDVPICTGITAVDLEDGSTVLLEAGQGLYFGDDMDRSLINPNQIRAFGVAVCDDPTDPHRPLGIDFGDMSIPMKMNGSICYFTSRSPTDAEIDSCRRFQISDEHSWDPTSEIFISSVERGESYSGGYIQSDITKHIYKVAMSPPFDLHFDNSHYFHEFDVALAESGFSPDLLSDRIVANVMSNKRHHGTDPNLLSKKWGIRLQKAKDTISRTTQLNIRSPMAMVRYLPTH